MDNTERLNLGQMARRYKKTPKTIRKLLDEKGVEFWLVGRERQYDPAEADKAFRTAPKTLKRRPQQIANVPGRFAERLGLI